MNYFRATQRYLENLGRVFKFTSSEEILDPQRIVNRTLYGTDYDPDEVRFREDSILRTMLEKSGSQPHYMDEIGKAYQQMLIQGFGILEHKWVNGQLHIGCIPSGVCPVPT